MYYSDSNRSFDNTSKALSKVIGELLSGTDQTEHYGRSDIIEHFRVGGISFQTQERKERKRD